MVRSVPFSGNELFPWETRATGAPSSQRSQRVCRGGRWAGAWGFPEIRNETRRSKARDAAARGARNAAAFGRHSRRGGWGAEFP